jgi:hypothetical protein
LILSTRSWFSRTLAPSFAAALLLTGLAMPAHAQDSSTPAPPKPNNGGFTITGANDFTNAYMFRGIRQETKGFIDWPYFDLAMALYSNDKGGLKSVTADIGTWNSIHSGVSGAGTDESGLGCACGKSWYESDFYATLGLGFQGGVSLGTTYTAYTSPNLMFKTVQEIAFKVALDDSSHLGKAAIKPYGLVAFEFKADNGHQADGGLHRGTYVELGVGPGYSWPKASISVPVKVGLSGTNYYEFNGTSDVFGYFSSAGIVTIPFSANPTRLGTWNLHGGVEYQKYGGTLKDLNLAAGLDHSYQWIGSVGIGFTY